MKSNRSATRLAIVFVALFFFPGSLFGQTAPDRFAISSADPVVSFYTSEVDPASIEAFMQAMEDLGTRFALADNRREVAEWIREQFVSFGYADARLDSFELIFTYRSLEYQTWQYNVIAGHTGYLWPDSIHILGAHYDSIVTGNAHDPFAKAPGADDNASGVAALLETARLFKEHGYEPENTIQFIAFAAEELGLHGSRFHANRAAANKEGIVMMINNDMISYTDRPESMWTLQIQFYPDSDWLTALARDIALAYTSLNVVESNSVIRFTDSWPFHTAGFDAVFLHEDRFNPFYHSPEDLVKHTNRDYAAEMVKVSVGMLVSRNGSGDPALVSVPGDPPPMPKPYRIYSDGRSLHLWFDREEPESLLQVFDITGRLVVSRQLGPGQQFRQQLPPGPGVYMVRVSRPGEVFSEKVFLSDQGL
jgi:hypothetical protein